MRLRYSGRSVEGVEIPVETPSGMTVLHCPLGGEVEISDEMGASLLEQRDNWAPADAKAKAVDKAIQERLDDERLARIEAGKEPHDEAFETRMAKRQNAEPGVSNDGD